MILEFALNTPAKTCVKIAYRKSHDLEANHSIVFRKAKKEKANHRPESSKEYHRLPSYSITRPSPKRVHNALAGKESGRYQAQVKSDIRLFMSDAEVLDHKIEV